MIGRKAPPAPDTTPFDADRAQSEIIRSVVRTLEALACGLYVLVGGLLVLAVVQGRAVAEVIPGELWGAAAAATGVLGGLLVGTKAGGTGDKTTVNAEAGSTVALGGDEDPAARDADSDTGAGDVTPDSPNAVQSDADDPDTPAVEPDHGGEHHPGDDKPGAVNL